MRPSLCVTLCVFVLGCRPAVPAESPAAQPALSYQPCPLEAGTLEVGVGEEFALAASEGACLLIDETKEATFISVAEMSEDEEGFGLLQDDLRAFLRASGILGDAPRFTGRDLCHVLEEDVEVHTFVATPPRLPERAGFALSAHVRGGAILFVGFGETLEAATALQETLRHARLVSAESN